MKDATKLLLFKIRRQTVKDIKASDLTVEWEALPEDFTDRPTKTENTSPKKSSHSFEGDISVNCSIQKLEEVMTKPALTINQPIRSPLGNKNPMREKIVQRWYGDSVMRMREDPNPGPREQISYRKMYLGPPRRRRWGWFSRKVWHSTKRNCMIGIVHPPSCSARGRNDRETEHVKGGKLETEFWWTIAWEEIRYIKPFSPMSKSQTPNRSTSGFDIRHNYVKIYLTILQLLKKTRSVSSDKGQNTTLIHQGREKIRSNKIRISIWRRGFFS